VDQHLLMSANSSNNPPIRVVMVVQSLPPLPSGGAEIQALRLAEILQKKGIEPLFITPGLAKVKGHATINGVAVYRLHSVLNYLLDILFFIQKKSPAPKTKIEFNDEASKNNVISRKIGIGSRLRYLIFLANAYRFLRKRKHEFSIIHSHTIEWPGYVAAVLSKRLGKRLIIKDSTMNGITNILRFPGGAEKQQLIIRQGHFIAMTKVIEENLLAAGVNQKNISRIPNGIKIEGPFKKDYQASGKVLFVGNLYQQPAKGVDILLKAWKIVAKSFPACRLIVAGDGDLDTYRSYCLEHEIGNSVDFLGKYSNVTDLMVSADVFVLPSRREGMPNVLMEAMLRALPCVATDISGSQDLIEHMNTGILVPPLAVQQLADGIIYMLTHRQRAAQMAINARKKIIESYDIEFVAEEYIKLYHQ
jgi:glycosyltransferase involved in cell wall biosynthesis